MSINDVSTDTTSSSSSSFKIQTTQQQHSWPHHHHHHHHNNNNSPHQFYLHQPWLNSFTNNTTTNCNNTSSNLQMSLQQQPEPPEFAKEAMFEKPLTPSDVGKLNRLVIPKQYAEKYFPLGGGGVGGGGGGDSGSDKGLLLSFEDESGKLWRFRYSYWNSSQSYVLTKGWSRYVKEKRLDAGDVILFERHRSDSERLFIGWRRRGSAPPDAHSAGGWPKGLPSSTHPYADVTVPLYQHAGKSFAHIFTGNFKGKKN